jgi:hypothetical protein
MPRNRQASPAGPFSDARSSRQLTPRCIRRPASYST